MCTRYMFDFKDFPLILTISLMIFDNSLSFQFPSQLHEEGLISPVAFQIFLDVTENARLLVESVFNLTEPLYFDYTHLVCRMARDGMSLNFGKSAIRRYDMIQDREVISWPRPLNTLLHWNGENYNMNITLYHHTNISNYVALCRQTFTEISKYLNFFKQKKDHSTFSLFTWWKNYLEWLNNNLLNIFWDYHHE